MANQPVESSLHQVLPHAWWLLPAEPWRTRLQAEIESLAAITGGPVFGPHMTLALGSWDTTQIDWSALADVLAASFRGVSLQAGPRGHTERYFQTLFIRFGLHSDTSQVLAARREQLAAAMMGVVSGDAGKANGRPEAAAGGQASVQGALSRETGVSAVRADALTRALDVRDGKARSATAFTAPIEPAFEPHLSLCYANLPAAERSRLASLGSIEGEWIRFDTLVCVRPKPEASTMDQVSDWDCFLRVPLSLS